MRPLPIFALVALVSACGGKTAPSAPASAAPIDGGAPNAPVSSARDRGAAEILAWKRAKPAFDHFCKKCHAGRAKRDAIEMFDMTTYPFKGRRAKLIGDAVRDVLGQSGMAATMPKGAAGTIPANDLALILAWCDAWARAHDDTTRDHL